jgi:predicted O-linked N-acetylglucosamine transferase (SPINDLY family)
MCSRMAASILKGALPKSPAGKAATKELVAADEDEYERFAIRLASSLTHTMVSGQDGMGYVRAAGRLADLRRLLWDSKWTCPLFDTRRWVRDLEDAYDEAWRRWVEGEGGDIHLDHVKRGGH